MSKVGYTFIVVLCVLTGLLTSYDAHAAGGSIFQQWGDELLAQMEVDFGRGDGLYDQNSSGSYPDFAWGQGVMSNALTAAAKIDSSYLQRAIEQADEFHARYWCTQNGTSGYNASYGNCGDRYYDDNAWIALALLELYELTENETYLTWARETVTFCMTGENGPDDSPDGGIRWHESNTSGASVCSTAPTMLANLMIHQLTGIESYLTDGARLYHWIIDSDLRYSSWIFHETAQGPLGYQTAVVTQTALRLYQITGDDTYLQQAQWMGAAMEHEFINKDTHILHQTGKWGGHDMTNAYVDLYEVDHNRHWLNVAAGYVEYLRNNCRDLATGRYTTSWDNAGGAPSNELIDNASAARAFWKMASTLGGAAPTYINIKNRSSNRVLRLYNSQTADDTHIVLYDQHLDYTSEMFALVDLGNGYYNIRSWKTDKSLQPYNNEDTNDTNVVINPANANLPSQQWKLIDLGNGYYNIQNRLTGKSMQPRYSGTTNNTSVITYTTNQSLQVQQWQLAGYNLPTSITPYLSTDGINWHQIDHAVLDIGETISLKGQAAGGGTWGWTGPDGFNAIGSEVTLSNIQAHQAGNYIATFTNSSGVESYSIIRVTVNTALKLYQHCPYHGWVAELGLGAYTAADLATLGAINNDASSFKIAPGYQVTFFDYDNFQGASLVMTADSSCLVDQGWNDRVTSLIIEGERLPVAHWSFNENGGTTVIDESGNNHTGALRNMDQDSWTVGKRCSGLSFDGVDDYVGVAGYKGITGQSARTCTAWVKTTKKSAHILSWGAADLAAKWVVRTNDNGALRTEVTGGYVYGSTDIADGKWHHIAVVLDDELISDIGRVLLFVDGRLDAADQFAACPVNTAISDNVKIGFFATNPKYFQGKMDDVRIYDYPLSIHQIRQMYLADALVGDVDADGNIDLVDFVSLSDNWQDTDACDADLTCDCVVDIDDFLMLADQWLDEIVTE